LDEVELEDHDDVRELLEGGHRVDAEAISIQTDDGSIAPQSSSMASLRPPTTTPMGSREIMSRTARPSFYELTT
jgi:hypothetical protein